MPLILLLGFFSKPRMSQYPWIISWSCFESCWYPCTGPRGFLTQPAWAGRCWREGASFFLFLSFFPPLVTVGFGWSSINSTTSTGSSAGVNFTHLLQKQTLPFTVGIFLLSWVCTVCKCWSWRVQLCNFEKDTQIFNALLVAVQCFSPCVCCLCCRLLKWLFVPTFFRNMWPNYACSIWVKHGPCVRTKPKINRMIFSLASSA